MRRMKFIPSLCFVVASVLQFNGGEIGSGVVFAFAALMWLIADLR